jgi:hypothetical protein
MASPTTDRDYDLMIGIRRSADVADKMNYMGLSVTVLVFGLISAISGLHARYHFCGVY